MAADTKPVLEKDIVQKDKQQAESANSHHDQGLSEAMVGRLKLASVIMGVLIIICLVALIYGISQKAGNLAKTEVKTEAITAATPLITPQDVRVMTGDSLLTLPKGAKVKSVHQAAAGGLWLWIETSAGEALWRLDASGQPAQTISIETEAR